MQGGVLRAFVLFCTFFFGIVHPQRLRHIFFGGEVAFKERFIWKFHFFPFPLFALRVHVPEMKPPTRLALSGRPSPGGSGIYGKPAKLN